MLRTHDVPCLGLEMGTAYQCVVDFCLQITSEGLNSEQGCENSGAMDLEVIMEKVIEPLEKLAISVK